MMRRIDLVIAVLAGLTFLLAQPAQAFDPRPATAHAALGTTEVLFSPHDDVEAAILRVLRGARRTIHVQAYLLTSRTLGAALIEAKARGIRVEVLADREQTAHPRSTSSGGASPALRARGENSQIPLLAEAGIPVALEVRYAAAHNKIILVDAAEADGAVVTGSYNFTYSARMRNAENVVILRGNPPVLRAYLDNWKRHRAEAVPYAEAMLVD
jgi:phosphatidylserine/phosphatidylglycerophosphate/cardiolipin synthase-like enzyme